MKLTESQARRAIRKWLFEFATDSGVSHRPSTDDKIAGKLGDDREDQPASTIPQEIPIVAMSQMSTQLTDAMPPIEDPDFIPGTIEELGRSVDLISRQVPHEQLEWFYEKVVELADESIEKANSLKLSDLGTEDEDGLEMQIRPSQRSSQEAAAATNESWRRWSKMLRSTLSEAGARQKDAARNWKQGDRLDLYQDDGGGYVDDDGEYVPTAEELEDMGEGDPTSVYGYREDIHSPEALQRRRQEIAAGEGGEAKLRELLSLNLFPGVTTMSGLKKKIDAEINPIVQMWFTANPAFSWLQGWYDDRYQLTWQGKQIAGPDVYQMAIDAYIKYYKKNKPMKDKLADAIERGGFYEEAMAALVMKPIITKWRKAVKDGDVDVSSSKAKNTFEMSDWIIETVLDSGFGKSGNKRKSAKVVGALEDAEDFIAAIKTIEATMDDTEDLDKALEQQDIKDELP